MWGRHHVSSVLRTAKFRPLPGPYGLWEGGGVDRYLATHSVTNVLEFCVLIQIVALLRQARGTDF